MAWQRLDSCRRLFGFLFPCVINSSVFSGILWGKKERAKNEMPSFLLSSSFIRRLSTCKRNTQWTGTRTMPSPASGCCAFRREARTPKSCYRKPSGISASTPRERRMTRSWLIFQPLWSTSEKNCRVWETGKMPETAQCGKPACHPASKMLRSKTFPSEKRNCMKNRRLKSLPR